MKQVEGFVVVDTNPTRMTTGVPINAGPIYTWDAVRATYNMMVESRYPDGDTLGYVVIGEIRLVDSGKYRGEEDDEFGVIDAEENVESR